MRLFDALVVGGWVDVREGALEIHGWNERNSRLLANWSLGDRRGAQVVANQGQDGSLGLAKAEPWLSLAVTQAEPSRHTGLALAEPRLSPCEYRMNEGNEGGEGNEGVPPLSSGSTLVEWPKKEEWLAAAEMEGLPAELAEREWNYQESRVPEKRWRGIDRTRLRHYAAMVLSRTRMSEAVVFTERKRVKAGDRREQTEGEIARLNAIAPDLAGEALRQNRAKVRELWATL